MRVRHVAHCHLGLGKLYRRTDKHEQAQEHLTTAATMYREMGMTYWLENSSSRGQGGRHAVPRVASSPHPDFTQTVAPNESQREPKPLT